MNRRIVIFLIILLLLAASAFFFFFSRTADHSQTDMPQPTEIPQPTDTPEPVAATDTPVPEKEDDDARIIYLTFDDGPGESTARLLKVLDEYGVKATFFVTNKYPGYSDYIKQESILGHSIGAHSYSHDLDTVYDDYISDLNEIEELIRSETSSYTSIIRFPGGSSNTIARDKMGELIQILSDAGYVYYDWDVDSCDATSAKTADEVLRNMEEGVLSSKKYSVILCHDVYEYTVDAVEQFIPWALENGFEFEKLEYEGPVVHHHIDSEEQQ